MKLQIKPGSPLSHIWSIFGMRAPYQINSRKKNAGRKKIPDTEMISAENMSDKISSKTYRGIFYVDLEQLPAHQQQSILKSGTLQTIKIKTDRRLLTDCIQYHKYEKWYDEEYVEECLVQNQLLQNLVLDVHVTVTI